MLRLDDAIYLGRQGFGSVNPEIRIIEGQIIEVLLYYVSVLFKENAIYFLFQNQPIGTGEPLDTWDSSLCWGLQFHLAFIFWVYFKASVLDIHMQEKNDTASNTTRNSISNYVIKLKSEMEKYVTTSALLSDK